MNIVYASDNNFADVMGVSIVSLLENNKNAESINLFIIDDSISIENKNKLTSLAVRYNRKLAFIPVPNIEEVFGVRIILKNLPLTAYSRLFIESLLPSDVERVLYLDCDVLIVRSIEEFYDTNIDDYYAAGTLDIEGAEGKIKLGLSANDPYYNSGVLLLNIKKMRLDNVQQKYIDFLIKHNGFVPHQNDQGVINGTINASIKAVPLAYNVTTLNFAMSYKAMYTYKKIQNYYTKSEVLQSIENPVIIHFTGNIISLRPWIKGCTHPYTDEWLNYKALSPWKDMLLKEDNRLTKSKFFIKIYKLLPETFAASIAGLFSNNVLPWMKGKRKYKAN